MEIDNGGPAFPESGARGNAAGGEGMCLRDYFAAKAMQAMLAGHFGHYGHENYWAPKDIAQDAYAMADAMLAARKGGV